MKVCKKCKKKVPNKDKICRYCGADVSKAKIIPTKKKQPVKQEIKPIEEIPQVKETKQINFIDLKNKSIKFIKKEYNDLFNHKKTKKLKTKKLKTKKQIEKEKNKRIIKYMILIVILILLLLGINKFITSLLFQNYNAIVVTKQDNPQVFEMKEKINYNEVIYQVKKVETSKGTEFKKPKEGNQFLIIYLKIINISEEKIRYSNKSWKMENSNEEETKRIFTPIDIKTALYSDNLPIGAEKEGTLVFEEPIDDQNLKLNFYDIIEDEETDEIIFSIKIEIPKE